MGPNPISRAAAPNPQMPASQGYIATGGDMFRPDPAAYAFAIPNDWQVAPREDWIGNTWAPGQGGDTPGGGGAALIGESRPVDVGGWVQNGFVNPLNFSHAPGTVGASSRRGRAG